MNVVILLSPLSWNPRLSLSGPKLYYAYMVASSICDLKYRRHMAFTAPSFSSKKQGNATLFPLTRQSRICKTGQCRVKAKQKLFNETCVEARVYLCAWFPVRNKAPLCERHCIHVIKKSMANATQEEITPE